MPESNGPNSRFSANEIKEALKRLEPVLGRSNIDALIDELENLGLPLANDRLLFSIEEIQAAIDKIFGREAGSIIFGRLAKELLKE